MSDKRPHEDMENAVIHQQKEETSEETKSADNMFSGKIILKLELFTELYYYSSMLAEVLKWLGWEDLSTMGCFWEVLAFNNTKE